LKLLPHSVLVEPFEVESTLDVERSFGTVLPAKVMQVSDDINELAGGDVVFIKKNSGDPLDNGQYVVPEDAVMIKAEGLKEKVHKPVVKQKKQLKASSGGAGVSSKQSSPMIMYKAGGKSYSANRYRDLQFQASKYAKDLLQPYTYSKMQKKLVPSMKYIKAYGTKSFADKSELKYAE